MVQDNRVIIDQCNQLLGKLVRVVFKENQSYIGKLDRVEKDSILIMKDARLMRVEFKDFVSINEYHIFKDQSGYTLEAVVNPETNQIEVFAFYKK